MSFLESRIKFVPTGIRKVLYLNWPIILLTSAVASVGVLMLWSIAGGDFVDGGAHGLTGHGVREGSLPIFGGGGAWFGGAGDNDDGLALGFFACKLFGEFGKRSAECALETLGQFQRDGGLTIAEYLGHGGERIVETSRRLVKHQCFT